jgi:DNA repair protein RecN (Recombination protein N)
MLTELRVRNFAIIESLTLPLAPGFNVLSGETGAGKSIIVGALGLLLGDRASVDLIRTGSDRAIVEGVFDVGRHPEIVARLDARGIDVEDGRVVLRREIAAAGRARAWVNGTTVTGGVLSEIGHLLVNLHGQHEAQSLLDPESQRAILDAFGGAAPLAERVRASFDALSALRQERAALAARRAAAERQADYLRHVVAEIDDAAPRPGEDAALDGEARRLENAEELRALALSAREAIEGDDGAALPRLAGAQRALAALQRIDPSLARLQELYDTGYYAIEELGRELVAYGRGIDLDPERLGELHRRRDQLIRLTKKYGATIDAVLETARRARAELDLVDTAGIDLAQMERREASAIAALGDAARLLTAARAAAAAALARAVDAMLPELGMPDGRFAVALERLSEPGASGAEDVEFRVALNVGHAERLLERVASGGELSRVMLCLTTILAAADRVPTLVFDEVDAGIGGRVALQVGDTLRRVALHHQVFAITHLPQIAARAHHHILVTKGVPEGVTTADVRVLDGEPRVHEIARMLGGDPERSVSREHARELLASAESGARSIARRGRRGGGVRAAE